LSCFFLQHQLLNASPTINLLVTILRLTSIKTAPLLEGRKQHHIITRRNKECCYTFI
jgi:hypothetical protein